MSLTLPDNILEEEEIKAMPPTERSQYIERVIEKTLELNTEQGVTQESVYRTFKFDRRCISKHLELLVARRIAYKVIQGNGVVYFKNGRLLHHIFKKDIDLGKRSYSFKALFDGKDVLIYIQENKKNALGIVEEGGGIIVPLKDLPEFSKCVSGIQDERPLIHKQLIKVID